MKEWNILKIWYHCRGVLSARPKMTYILKKYKVFIDENGNTVI